MSKTWVQEERVLIHFDYDCFYASVVEQENPALKSVPLAIQQKQIIVTCNYEARRRGLRKLQLVTDAKKTCPDVVIVLGEDITPFRNASKELYAFLRDAIWSQRAEKLGFDEVWLDCTDMVDYNVALLNENDLAHSYFCLSKDDPTYGFEFDASRVFGPIYPANIQTSSLSVTSAQHRRLILGSHLARHLRHELESQKGYTATVGIASNKLLSKLVGNVNKPKNQTTIIPVEGASPEDDSAVAAFMDSHDIGKVPGIGFKLAQKIRSGVLGREATFHEDLVYGLTKESVSVRDVRLLPGMGPEMLEDILSGPGSQKGIGGKIWGLINGIDNTEVAKARRIPSQISQEDSYMKYLRGFEDVKKQLHILAKRLIERMHIDLMEDDYPDDGERSIRRWLGHPRTLRLSTRPRPLGSDGGRSRMSQRISRSSPMPNFTFSLNENVDALADRLVEESLIPMFRKLHPEKNGWNLSLINVAATNMAETAAESKDSEGRDIGRMFKRQDEVLRDFRVVKEDQEPDEASREATPTGNEEEQQYEQENALSLPTWDDEEAEGEEMSTCSLCQAEIPYFATSAHERYHSMHD